MSDGVCPRVDFGRGPLQYRTDITRYGIQQRNTKWHPEGETGWYGGWPSYERREWAEVSLREYRDAWGSQPKYEHRIVVFPPEPPPFAYRLERM